MSRQSCSVCAWRENCSKRFSIPDGGARCPDFSRDVRIRELAENDDKLAEDKEPLKK